MPMAARSGTFPRFAFWLLALVVFASAAQSADREEDEPISINARSVEANDKTGTVVYSGNVEIEQGSLSIEGARVEIHTRRGKTELIRATGKPAKLRQRATGENTDIRAEALRVDYRVSTRKVDMLGKVRLRRGADVFTADTLHYDLAANSLNAAGDDKGDGRVRAVIQPKKPEVESAPRP